MSGNTAKIVFGLPGTLSSSDDAPDVLAGVVGLLDQIDLSFPGFNGGGDGSVEVGEGLVPLPGGLSQFAHGAVDGFAHRDRMTHKCGLVQLTATREWPRVCAMTTEPTTTRSHLVTTPDVDRELAAVLITLAPLGDRAASWVDIRTREFDADAMLRGGWSSGERWLIVCAKALWRGTPEKIDLSYIATLDTRFMLAVMNGVAAYRGADFSTDWAAALRSASAPARSVVER